MSIDAAETPEDVQAKWTNGPLSQDVLKEAAMYRAWVRYARDRALLPGTANTKEVTNAQWYVKECMRMKSLVGVEALGIKASAFVRPTRYIVNVASGGTGDLALAAWATALESHLAQAKLSIKSRFDVTIATECNWTKF